MSGRQDKNTRRQKYKKTERQKDLKKTTTKINRQRDRKTKKEFNIVMSEQFRTLAMFFFKNHIKIALLRIGEKKIASL